jgi:rhodanese-related sulfurtransferase
MVTSKMVDDGLKKRFEDCQKQANHYQSFFSCIPTMTSEHLVAMMKHQRQQQQHKQIDGWQKKSSSLLILIDVRTSEEQEVSMIPGSITLDEFHQRMDSTMRLCGGDRIGRTFHRRHHKDDHLDDDDDHVNNPDNNHRDQDDNDKNPVTDHQPPTNHRQKGDNKNRSDHNEEIDPHAIVVTYCTIGYRSGREAQHLADQYPNFFRTSSSKDYDLKSSKDHQTKAASTAADSGADDNDNGYQEVPEGPNLFNLDGILAYTYVEDAPPLEVRRRLGANTVATTTSTNQIHTYGPAWDLAHPNYQPVWFKNTKYGLHALQTVGCSLARSIQHVGCIMKNFVTCNGCWRRESSSKV